jgi:hypothetical protein
MRIIAFSGPKTCGKDTAAKFLLDQNKLLMRSLFMPAPFAEPVKGTCQMIFGFSAAQLNDMPFKEQPIKGWPDKTPRFHMQNVAKMFRTYYGGDVWVQAWERKIATLKTQCIVVTDLRHTEELETLKSMGAIICYVQRDIAEAELTTARAEGNALASDVSESFYHLIRKEAHYTITNNGTISELHEQVAKVARAALGDYHTWGLSPLPTNLNTGALR